MFHCLKIFPMEDTLLASMTLFVVLFYCEYNEFYKRMSHSQSLNKLFNLKVIWKGTVIMHIQSSGAPSVSNMLFSYH